MENNAITSTSSSWITTDQADDPWRRAFWFWLSNFDSRHTREAYYRAWTQFNDFTSGLPPADITHEHVRAWRMTLVEHLSAASLNQKLAALSSFYEFIAESYPLLARENPVKGVRRAAVDPYGKATSLKGEEDIALLHSIPRQTLEGKRDYAIILLFLTTGVRLDAVVRARIADLNKEGTRFTLAYVNKGGAQIKKELPPNTYEATRLYLRARQGRPAPGDPLFTHKGKPLHRRTLQRMIQARCDACFGTGHGITPHSLRHTAAMNLIARKAPITEISSLLRHKNMRVTTIYIQHVNPGEGDHASQMLDERYE